MFCGYGCGQKARFTLKNGKLCCSDHYNKCPALRRKNSSGIKKAHKENPNMNPHIKKGIMNGWNEKWSYNNKQSGRYMKCDEEVFKIYSTYPTVDLKERLISKDLVKYKCNKCNIKTWLGEKISLHLHHINGNNLDNRIENLELLCPNCHSTTENYAGRGKNFGKKKVDDITLLNALKVEKNIRRALLKVGLVAKGANYNRAKKLSAQLETVDVEPLKFGETLTSNVDGNPEPSSLKKKRCRD